MERQQINKKAWLIIGLLIGALTLLVLIAAEMWRAAENEIRKESEPLLQLKAFFVSLSDKAIWKRCWETLEADIVIVRFSASLIGTVIHWLILAAIF